MLDRGDCCFEFRYGALRKDTSFPLSPLSIPSRTLPGERGCSVTMCLRGGETGTCSDVVEFGWVRGLSCRSSRFEFAVEEPFEVALVRD